jgi:3-hydroxyacyl-[acyl-carrier-protein] dehydratase
MLLVDRVSAIVPGESIVARKAISWNEPCYDGLPDGASAAYPRPLLMESWGQAGGILAAQYGAGRTMLFVSVADAEFGRPVFPGDVVEHRVRLTRHVADALFFEGESRCAGELVLTVASSVLALRDTDSPMPVPAGRPQ